MTRPVAQRSPLFGSVTGLLALDVLLQGVWAGLFLRPDAPTSSGSGWVTAHNIGGAVAVALAVIAAVVGHLQFRNRTITLASAALAVLLIAEYGIGQSISGGTDTLTAVHIPLALAITALATWLPTRARMGRQSVSSHPRRSAV